MFSIVSEYLIILLLPTSVLEALTLLRYETFLLNSVTLMSSVEQKFNREDTQ